MQSQTLAADRAALHREVEDFLFGEADLMDSHEYDAWLALWEDELLYWVPSNAEDIDPTKAVSIIYDGRDQLEDRLFRLKGRHAHAQSPKSRIIRTVSNTRVLSADDDRIVATSNFVLGEVRSGNQEVVFGKSIHTLVLRGGGLKMKEKKVFILSNDIPMRNLVFVL